MGLPLIYISRVDGFFGFYLKTKKPDFYLVLSVFTIKTSTHYNFFITKLYYFHYNFKYIDIIKWNIIIIQHYNKFNKFFS